MKLIPTPVTCAAMLASALPTAAGTGAPPAAQTLILDGFWGWHTRWEPLRKRITGEIGPCRIWHYNNSGFVSIETLGAQLAKEIAQAGGPVNLVGYSMGGLVVREALRSSPGLPVQKVVLLNSPHGGTLVSWLAFPLRACGEMRPGSAFLRRLEEAPWSHPTLATWCPWDLMVFPGASARWKKATVVVRDDTPVHTGPIFSRSIHRAVTEFLAPPAD